jgi:hypothetical protein
MPTEGPHRIGGLTCQQSTPPIEGDTLGIVIIMHKILFDDLWEVKDEPFS